MGEILTEDILDKHSRSNEIATHNFLSFSGAKNTAILLCVDGPRSVKERWRFLLCQYAANKCFRSV